MPSVKSKPKWDVYAGKGAKMARKVGEDPGGMPAKLLALWGNWTMAWCRTVMSLGHAAGLRWEP